MAHDSSSKGTMLSQAIPSDGLAYAGPPPSTLAAQLVENISASTKSSRSDENSELKGLFAVIQRVKDNPQLLKTPEERIEHNHMLIYVYARVVLEGIKFDDPFLDRTHLRAEILKAINFLRFTVKETPSVLGYCTSDGKLMFRGPEPLWIWLFPQLLRLLGHPQCIELSDSIENLIQYFLLVIAQTGVLWDLSSMVIHYLRTILTDILRKLQDTPLPTTQQDAIIDLSLPQDSTLDRILNRDLHPSLNRFTYQVSRVSQAIHQAKSLGNILMYPLISGETAFESVSSFSESSLWLFDTFLDLRLAERRWQSLFPDSPTLVIEMTFKIIRAVCHKGDPVFTLSNKACSLLVLLCGEMIPNPDSLITLHLTKPDVQRTYCVALLTIAQAAIRDFSMARLTASRLVNQLWLHFHSIPEETDTWRAIETLNEITAFGTEHVFDWRIQPSNFQDDEVRKAAEALSLTYEGPDNGDEAPAKRRKLSQSGANPILTLIDLIYETLKLSKPSDGGSTTFEQNFQDGFQKADSSSQCLAIDLLSRTCCVADDASNQPCSSRQEARDFQCSICDPNVTSAKIDSQDSAGLKDGAQKIFSGLVRSAFLTESRRPRVAVMIGLRRLVLHCDEPVVLNLETSLLGQWCLQSLSSSVRELRIAAGRTLATFILERPSGRSSRNLVVRNRKNSLALLRSISEKDQANLIETCIMAWGQLGRVVTENELNLVLIKLMEYLGSSNSFVSGLAFNELLNLAEARGVTPRRLFEPFWPSLAYMTTKDMVHRPQMSRATAELLQISVNDLLLLIQTHALPYLVLDKQKDVVQKFSEARQDKETADTLMDPTNIAAVLTLLMTQETEDIEMFTRSRLAEISPRFEPSESFFQVLQSEPVLLIIELLKAAGDADDARKLVVRKALHTMATVILPATKESKQKKGNIIGRLLQAQMLGLMARFADVINESMFAIYTVKEQLRCIRAMEEMIRVCKDYARIARPQISACLLSALSEDALREQSFSCWAAMLAYLEEEDVESLLETTFFVVNHYWSVLNGNAAATAKKMLNSLMDNYDYIVTKYINKLPSLQHIPELKDLESRLQKVRGTLLTEEALEVFSERVAHENSGVVLQALSELVPYLEVTQTTLHTSAVSQQPDTVIETLMRALLDCACKYSGIQADISRLCMRALGLVGCVDYNKIEAVREQRSIVVLNNFGNNEEVTDFVLFVLEVVLVPAFLSATDAKFQGFLSFAMQELLDRADIKTACAMQNVGMLGGNDIYRKWIALPEVTREVITPFLASRYMVAPMKVVPLEYPVFRPGRLYASWLRLFVVDLLQKGQTPYAELIYEPLTRVIRVKDLSTSEFLLPYLALHIFLGSGSIQKLKENVLGELVSILQHQPAEDASYMEREEMKRYCQAVFRVIDYAMRWIQAKRATGHMSETDRANVSNLQEMLDTIPAELISQRAIDCNDYARALFHLEQHAQKMEQRKREPDERNDLLKNLQDIYANIDEPDGLDGISAHLHDLDINQQILSHRKAGRWTAVQSWYEMQLAEKPDNVDVQVDLLNCLKQAGQHDVLLNHVEGMHTDISTDNKIMPFAVEAAWATGRWENLTKFTKRFREDVFQDFNISLATIFEALHKDRNSDEFKSAIREMRDRIAETMNTSATASLQACHELLIKCHVLTDLEIIIGAKASNEKDHESTMALLDRRLEIIGGFYNDKQYLLGVRRAAMELTRPVFSDFDISASWLSSAKLARKTNSLHQSFTAVLHASQLGDDAATIENAKLLWIGGHHRKAIQMLQGAIEKNKFMTQTGTSTNTGTTKLNPHQRLLTARAQLLLAKWLDTAGQSYAGALREKYQQPPKTYSSWEKGHYYLGRHYKKCLEAEKPFKVDDQSDNYLTGEIARLVIENYVRSLNAGTKYLYQTLPRILTIWLEMGANVDKAPEGKTSLNRELHRRRVEQLNLLHSFLDKYIHRLPAYIFYTALPQIVARIAHPNAQVFDRLLHIIVKVVEAHPRQALWSLIGIMTTRQVTERKARGTQILQNLRSISRKVEGSSYDMKYLLRMGERLAEQLLLACQNGDFQGNKTVHASLTRDLRFNHKCTPCQLVVPVESCLNATLPAVSEYVKKHKAFSRDVVTIDCFLDDVLVLSSLAKPRRLTARGSDGKSYMLLVKPKDDLRTDQRLMEFNGIINRSLKRDAESSRRQLYIRTYAVTPLNEECGIIEWIPGIKTMRDILINLYASRKIYPDYGALRQLMDEASASNNKIRVFTDDVLGRFPPMLHLWFIQQFPNPSTWFAARLRYTRSCAVMSMVGTILGLGDRHGENVNLEEGNGGVFHVDFNCLFDKGLTFAKPERVPFRLTHNMVAAMGIYGYEGPFRKSCELTLSILRQQEETLMTILEAFIYDPTLDLQKEKRPHRKGDTSIKLTSQGVVDSIRRKVKGLLPHESIPLGVEGQVDELIKQAVDPKNLTAMYIGWCPFL